jgi:hypothetical protein
MAMATTLPDRKDGERLLSECEWRHGVWPVRPALHARLLLLLYEDARPAGPGLLASGAVACTA